MKRIKKIGAWLMAVVFVTFMMGTSVFAAQGDVPKTEQKKTVEVTGIEDGATVTAYKITEGVYTKEQLTGFVSLQNDGKDLVADPKAPTAAEVTTAANLAISGKLGTGTVLQSKGSGTYQAELEPGSYVVVVTGTVQKIYNPMLVSVGYDVDGNITGGKVDASQGFKQGGTVVYAKSSDVTVEKTIEEATEAKQHAIDTELNKEFTFQIDTKIPSYSDKYTDIVFNINDSLTGGLKYASNPTVTVGGAEITEGEGTYTLKKDDKSFTIVFAEAFIKANGLKNVHVEYKAKVTDATAVNFDASTNTASVSYTNNDGTKTDSKEVKDYIYTFEINGELIKTDGTNPLAGAVFGIYSDEGYNNAIKDKDGNPMTATTDKDGNMIFSGLDAATYYVKEITPPKGYSLTGKVYKVTITATYKESGELDKYTVTVDDNENITAANPVRIPNTKMSELPSTGGIGTYGFTIGGVMLMTSAVAMFIISRRKKEINK